MTELKSRLPHGYQMPVGDQTLWDACMASGTNDPMSVYAEVRGISRLAAKEETFIIRYSAGPKTLKEMFCDIDEVD